MLLDASITCACAEKSAVPFIHDPPPCAMVYERSRGDGDEEAKDARSGASYSFDGISGEGSIFAESAAGHIVHYEVTMAVVLCLDGLHMCDLVCYSQLSTGTC